MTGERWTRTSVLGDPLFYLVVCGIMAPPAIGTLFIFHQAHLVEAKGWDLTVFTALFPIFSLTVVLTSLLAGLLVDRLGAWRLLPLLLIPEGIGCIVLGALDPTWSIALFLVCFGLTQGLMNPVVGALWAEIYGTAHLGAIRSMVTAALVSASAIGPGLAGYLIDAGIELNTQASFYAAYCFGGSALYLVARVLSETVLCG